MSLVASQRPPLALYVHLPWCVRKCPYCDFNSRPLTGGLPERAYVDALLADLAGETRVPEGRPLVSIFLGGGTPSLFSPEAVARLLAGVRERLVLAPACEITLEANPGAADAARFRDYRGAGVNRLSIGVQSFDDGCLRRIGRIHDAREAERAVAAAADAGFANVNVDLMYGLPGQTGAGALADLRRALALDATHISHYQLTLEPGTAFHRHPPRLPGEDVAWRMQTQCQALLRETGFEHYEVSAYARRGRRCRHNLNYWRFGDYLGIGAGAHGKRTDAAGRIWRTEKHRDPRRYLGATGAGDFVAARRAVAAEEAAFEFMLNALRLVEGFEPAGFERRTGLGLDSVAELLTQARGRGLIERNHRRIRATPLGRRFLDDLVALFLPARGLEAREA
jgi:putative oxygen-independent coproporphyrinogen III oxidase